MQLLKDRIRKDGKVKAGNVLKVDSFLNHQMDIALFGEIGKEFLRLYDGCGVTKILTIEASGIGIALHCCPVFSGACGFCQKEQNQEHRREVYTSKVESFTHGRVYDIIVSKDFLLPEDKVLIIDDFLANGSALMGLISLVRDAGADLVGAGIVIEKGFQPGGRMIRDMGVRIESLAIVDGMDEEHGGYFPGGRITGGNSWVVWTELHSSGYNHGYYAREKIWRNNHEKSAQIVGGHVFRRYGAVFCRLQPKGRQQQCGQR